MLRERAQQGAVVPPARRRGERGCGGRRLRAGPGRAGAARSSGILQVALVLLVRNTLAVGGVRGRAATPRPPTAARPTASRCTREQIDGAISGRFARDVTVAPGRRSTAHPASRSPCAPRCRRSGIGGPASTLEVTGHAVEERAVSAGATRRARQRAGRADLARHPAAGPDAVDRAVGLRGAARRVRRQRARPARPAAPTRWLPTDAAGRRRAEAAARQALADQGLADAPLDVRVTCTPYPARLPQRHVGDHGPGRLPGRPAAAARRPRRRRAELRARRHPHGADRPVPGGRPVRRDRRRTSAARRPC